MWNQWAGATSLGTGSPDAKEQALLATLPAAIREEWLLRLWCAKEAVGKARVGA